MAVNVVMPFCGFAGWKWWIFMTVAAEDTSIKGWNSSSLQIPCLQLPDLGCLNCSLISILNCLPGRLEHPYNKQASKNFEPVPPLDRQVHLPHFVPLLPDFLHSVCSGKEAALLLETPPPFSEWENRPLQRPGSLLPTHMGLSGFLLWRGKRLANCISFTTK